MKAFIVTMSLFIVVACGGTQKEPASSEREASSEPVWEDVDDAAYKFYRSVSKTLLRTNQPKQAAETIRRLFKLKPEDPEPPYLMGLAYMALEHNEEAVRMFKLSVEHDDSYAASYSMMGTVLSNLGRHKEATDACLHAVEIDENNAAYYNNLGFAYYLSGDFQAASTAYSKAVEIDPGSKRIHNNLGFALGRQGNLVAAQQQFRLAGAADHVNNNMGFVYESRGDLETAYRYYAAAVRQNPALTEARQNLERVCARLGRSVPNEATEPREQEGDANADAPSSKG